MMEKVKGEVLVLKERDVDFSRDTWMHVMELLERISRVCMKQMIEEHVDRNVCVS